MRIFRFTPEEGRALTEFGSVEATFNLLLRTELSLQTSCIRIGPGGLIGYHPATVDQFFLVVEGSGQVRAGEDGPVEISAGEAAFWQAGEWHESSSDNGMMAIVIEGEGLDPARFLREREG